ARRPSSARAVAAEAVRLGARLEGLPLPPEERSAPLGPAFVGRAPQLDALLQALAGAQVVVVEGDPGTGRSRLVQEARRAMQLSAAAQGRPAAPWHGPTLAEAARTLGVEPPRGDLKGWMGAVCARLSERPA